MKDINPLYREYSFSEWCALSTKQRQDIINNFWSLYEPQNGVMTRHEILKEFIKMMGSDFYICEFGGFSWGIIGIKYIPERKNRRCPTHFFDVVINKGVLSDYLFDEDKYMVKWRYTCGDLFEEQRRGNSLWGE